MIGFDSSAIINSINLGMCHEIVKCKEAFYTQKIKEEIENFPRKHSPQEKIDKNLFKLEIEKVSSSLKVLAPSDSSIKMAKKIIEVVKKSLGKPTNIRPSDGEFELIATALKIQKEKGQLVSLFTDDVHKNNPGQFNNLKERLSEEGVLYRRLIFYFLKYTNLNDSETKRKLSEFHSQYRNSYNPIETVTIEEGLGKTIVIESFKPKTF